MDPITLLILGIIGAAAATAAISWTVIQNWIDANKIPQGTARIIKSRMASGKYRVVGGVFNQVGTLVTQTSWEASKIDDDLDRRLRQSGGVIVIKT